MQADFDRILEKCPGAVGGVEPAPGMFGYNDIVYGSHLNATDYLASRGARYVEAIPGPSEAVVA